MAQDSSFDGFFDGKSAQRKAIVPASGTVTYVKVWTPFTLEIVPATNGNKAGKKIRTAPAPKGTND